VKPQKSRRAASNLAGRAGVPFAGKKRGDEGEEPHHQHFTARSTTQRLLSKKTARMGDKAKALVFVGRRLCCVNSTFLCSLSHRAKSKCGQVQVRLALQGRWIIAPHTAKRRKLKPRLPKGRGFLFVRCI